MSYQQQQSSRTQYAYSYPELNYLGFVNSVQQQVYDIGNSYYTWAKKQIPEGKPKELVGQAEDITRPYVNFGQDLFERLLKDSDYRVTNLVNVLRGYQGDAEKLKEQFKQKREQYIAQLQESLNKAKQQNPELANRIQKQIDDLKKIPDDAHDQYNQLYFQLQQNWNQFSNDPRVAKALDSVRPQLEQSRKFAEESQSRLLNDQRYANLYNFITYHAQQLFHQPLVQNVYTSVKPYANKVISEEKQNEYYNTVVKNIQPNVPPTDGNKPATQAPKPTQ